MGKYKRILSTVMLLVLILCPFFVLAEEAGSNEAEFFSDVSEFLNEYVPYDLSDGKHFKSAIMNVLEKHPEVYEEAMRGMLSSIDENSAYYNEEEYTQVMEKLSGEFSGIGINVIQHNDELIVGRTLPNSPAQRSNLQVGDIIVTVDEQVITGMDLDSAVSLIRGESGTEVTLEIKRAGYQDLIKIILKRELIKENPITYSIDTEKKVAHIQITTFNGSTNESLVPVLNEINKAGIENIIIDLRNNVGGYLNEAIAVSNHFIPNKGLIVTEEFKNSQLNRKFFSTLEKKQYNVVVLVNGWSASASEIVTGAVKDHKAGIIVGEQTFGKGTVQDIMPLKRGGAIRFTVAKYTTPSGENIHQVGISPDIYLKNYEEEIDLSKFGKFTFTQTFQLGDSEQEIKNAKEMLEILGYYISDSKNEDYDESTKIAVSLFQKEAGLYDYGVLDITTQCALYNEFQMVKVVVDKQLEAAYKAFELFDEDGNFKLPGEQAPTKSN